MQWNSIMLTPGASTVIIKSGKKKMGSKSEHTCGSAPAEPSPPPHFSAYLRLSVLDELRMLKTGPLGTTHYNLWAGSK